MSRHAERLRSLGGLVAVAACLPTLLALATLLALHWNDGAALRRELQQRGSLIAAALAEASEYGLISGNPAALDRSMRELRARDPSIAAIDVLDGTRRAFVALAETAGTTAAADEVSIELPVRSSVPDIDFFDRPTPHVSLPDDVQPTFRLGPVVGYVRVRMSTAALAAARDAELRRQLLAVAATGLLGAAIVVALAARLRATLRALAATLRAMARGRYDVGETPDAAGDLGRVQQAALALCEELAGQARERARLEAESRAAALREPTGPITVGRGTAGVPRGRHAGVARRVMGRVDAGLGALRLAAYGSTRLAELARSENDRQQANETALRILGIAEQVNTAGTAVLDPLRQHIVDGVGLDGALDELLHGCALAHPTCRFEFHNDVDLTGVDTHQGMGLHRALQDLIMHLIAYTDASQASVRLERSQDPAEVRALITSDGEDEGSSASAARMTQLRAAVKSYGGRLEVNGSPTEGTVVVLSVPAQRPS